MTRVKLLPSTDALRPDNGIGRVVYAQHKYLPQFGIELVEGDADLYVGHTQQFDMPRIDVLHVHGAYWLGDAGSGAYGSYHVGANAAIASASRRAKVITTPSEWVAMPWKRDMRLNPVVIGHGIDLAEWTPQKHAGYVLWAKNRMVDVCLPDAPYEMARRGINVISTYAPEGVVLPNNIKVIGRQESDAMRDYLAHAEVYLATVKETFGIQTIEAMACGVPVVGWDYGGTAEIVTNGYDGLLVKPGDYDALYAALQEAVRRRAELGANARRTAEAYDWPIIMQRYADLYHETAQAIKDEAHGVSVVITNHNYGRYVGEAIASVKAQTMQPAEIIVVDDGSTDDSLEVINAALSDQKSPAQYQVITQENQGVAAARTVGIEAATQPYIVCLDADDMIAPDFIAALQPAIDADRGLGIVYSGLSLLYENGSLRPADWPPAFDWEIQAQPGNPPRNCIPSACMFRREMWKRAGAHKQEYAPAEDAEFWTRGLSIGFDARRVTEAGLFIYRLHAGSASHSLPYKPIDDRLPWMRDRHYPLAAPTKSLPLIRSYSEPKVSIILTITKDTSSQVADTIDSILGQTMREWELIVIDKRKDARAWEALKRYPFVIRALDNGIDEARGALCLLIDAGDMLTNSALEEMLTAHLNSGGRYIYTNVLLLKKSKIETLVTPSYQQVVWSTPLHHGVALVPTAWAREVYSISASPAEFYSRLALAGYCGQHLGRALVITRQEPQAIKAKRVQKLEGRSMSNCCGGNGDALLAAKAALGGMVIEVVPPGQARLEYIGTNKGSISFFGKKREYRGGDNDEDRYIFADAEDVAHLVNCGKWRVVTLGITNDSIPDQSPIIEALPAKEETPEPIALEPEPVPVPVSAYDLPEPIEAEIKPTEAEVQANQVVATKVKTQRGRK